MCGKIINPKIITPRVVTPRIVTPKTIMSVAGSAKPKPIPEPDALNFYMPDGGTITLTKNGTPTVVELEYSIDGGATWQVWEEVGNVRSLTLAAGQTMHLRNTSEMSTRFSINSRTDYYNFAFTGDTSVGGNTNSLLCRIPSNAVITNCCYAYLFYNCTSLIMNDTFTLPSTTLAELCYYSMFRNSSITMSNTFTLPATMLANYCYDHMFFNCKSLMISDTFILPATVLETECYYNMFYGCKNVNLIKTNMIDISARNCLYLWLQNTSLTGDFYCPAELTIPTGSSGIPSGWTRHDL